MKVGQANVNSNYIDSTIGQQSRIKSAALIHGEDQENVMKKVAEKPAYIVDIETRYKSEANPNEMKNITSLTEDTADGALGHFRQSHLEHMNELSVAAPDKLDTSEPKFVLNSGADDIGGLFLAVRRMVEGGMAPAQEEQFFAQYEKYYNVQADIAERGKEAFLEYNLMFAGMAASYNDQVTEKYLDMFTEKGLYTQEDFDKVKNFAAELQDKSGVFVLAEFQRDDASGNDIRYSYMGALCTIGVDKLSSMADHREADEVWINAAKGVYQNEGELVQALRDGGYEDAAADYLKEWKNPTEEVLYNKLFTHQDGAMWDVTIGFTQSGHLNKEVFKDLQNKYFGREDAKVTYDAEQLKKAYNDGVKEAKNLGDTPFLNLVSHEAEKEENNGQNRLESLKQQLKELNKQITEIKSMALPEDKKSDMIKKFEQQAQTVQIQINDALESMSKEAKSRRP